jgi:hypothetical protein
MSGKQPDGTKKKTEAEPYFRWSVLVWIHYGGYRVPGTGLRSKVKPDICLDDRTLRPVP